MDRTSWTYSISQKGLQLKQYVYIILKQIIQYYYSTGNLICYVIFFFYKFTFKGINFRSIKYFSRIYEEEEIIKKLRKKLHYKIARSQGWGSGSGIKLIKKNDNYSGFRSRTSGSSALIYWLSRSLAHFLTARLTI